MRKGPKEFKGSKELENRENNKLNHSVLWKNNGMITCFKNGRVLRDHQLTQEDFWILDGKIINPQSRSDREVDVKGQIIAPGYIDIQINGAFGQDFSSKFETDRGIIAEKLPRHGVTSFLATIVSSKQENYPVLLSKKNNGHGANFLGFHLEGPFLNPIRKGAHQLECLRSFEEINSLEEFYGTLEQVKIVTLAVELPHAAKHIAALKQRGILVAAGHTEASFEAICQSGVSLVTHLYNAMPPFQGRNPGVVGAALTHPGLYYSIIADGIHCHPAAIRLAFTTKPNEMILVSDAMTALGLDPGAYQLGDMEVTVQKDRAYLKGTEILAGSIIGLDTAVRYLHQIVGCSVVEAIEAASLHPAKALHIEHQKGTLSIGADADFIFLNDSLSVQGAYVGGVEQKNYS